jgi:hypothetical protein
MTRQDPSGNEWQIRFNGLPLAEPGLTLVTR